MDVLLTVPPWLALVAVFLFPALEASVFVGVVVPGEIAIVLGGVLAHEQRLPLAAVLGAAAAGAVLGDTVGYAVGARHGSALLARIPDRLLPPRHVDRGTGLIRRLGGRAVFAGRWTASLRALIPGLSGLSSVPYRTFAVWNLVGGTTWAVAFVLLGYLAGAQYRRFEGYANTIGLAALGLVVALAVGRWLVGRRRRAARATGERGATEDGGVTEAVERS